MPPDILKQSLTLVGPGRAGRAFARSWLSAGGRLREVIGRDRDRADRAAREIGSGNPQALAVARSDCDILLLAVPDDAISPVARALAGSVTCRHAFHLSGALPAGELSPLRQSGTSIGSLHPLRAFTGTPWETWSGAFVAIEGDQEAADAATILLQAMGARGHRIPPEGKPLYHAAATLAAGGTVATLSLAVRAWAAVGLPEEEARVALSGLAAQAAAAAAEQAFENALTGPIARRDVGTVRAHRDALANHPETLRLYALLAEETLRRTPDRGREEEIRALLKGR